MLHARPMSRVVPALLLVAAVGCDESPTGTGPEPRIAVTDATLEAVGDAAWLEAVVEDSDASPRWESLDPEIVTVSESGEAVAVAAGTATVRAHIGAASGAGTVTVLPPVDIRLSELDTVTDPSGRKGMAMRIQNVGGRGYYRLEFWRYAPDGLHDRVLHYSSDADAPVGMNIMHYNYLLAEPADWVLALAREPLALEAVRTSCVRLDGGAECPSDLPEQPAPVDSVTVIPAGVVLDVGQTLQLAAHVFVNDVEVTDRTVVWSTTTPGRISVSQTGLIQALASGYGEVKAAVEDVSFTVSVTVVSPEPQLEPVAHLFIDTHNLPLRLWVGQGWRLQARVLNSQWQPIEGHTVTWGVHDPSIATVDSTGWLLATAGGITAVNATAGDRTAWVTLQSFVRPVDGAELRFSGLLSDSSGAQVQPSVDTTWVDNQGVEHPAFISFHSGHLSMDWSGAAATYEQRLTMRTFLYEDSLQIVAETEYVDAGSLRVLFDFFAGDHIYELTSAVTPGLVYLGRYSLPGELAVAQPIGSIPVMKFYFELP